MLSSTRMTCHKNDKNDDATGQMVVTLGSLASLGNSAPALGALGGSKVIEAPVIQRNRLSAIGVGAGIDEGDEEEGFDVSANGSDGGVVQIDPKAVRFSQMGDLAKQTSFGKSEQLMGGIELGGHGAEVASRGMSSVQADAAGARLSERRCSATSTSAVSDERMSATSGGRMSQDRNRNERSETVAKAIEPLNRLLRARTRTLEQFTTEHEAVRHRKHAFKEVMREFALETTELEPILTDLMRYDHNELVSESIGLLVRHFEQRKVLNSAGQASTLIVKQRMVEMIGVFDGLLRKLEFLSNRRRLFHLELYQASKLMSELCAFCYGEPDENDGRSAAQGSNRTGSHRTGRTRGGKSSVAMLDADHTRGMCLELVGRAEVQPKSTMLTLIEEEGSSKMSAYAISNVFRSGARLHIRDASGVSHVYTVRTVTANQRRIQVDRILEEPPADGIVWVMLENRVGPPE